MQELLSAVNQRRQKSSKKVTFESEAVQSRRKYLDFHGTIDTGFKVLRPAVEILVAYFFHHARKKFGERGLVR